MPEINPIFQNYDALYYYNRGIGLLNQKSKIKWERAIEYFLDAGAIEPAHPAIWSSAAECFMRLGLYLDAVRMFERGLQYDKQDPKLWYGKGLALNAMRNPVDAIPCLNNAIRLDPILPAGYYEKIIALYDLKRWNKLMTVFEQYKTRGFPVDKFLKNMTETALSKLTSSGTNDESSTIKMAKKTEVGKKFLTAGKKFKEAAEILYNSKKFQRANIYYKKAEDSFLEAKKIFDEVGESKLSNKTLKLIEEIFLKVTTVET